MSSDPKAAPAAPEPDLTSQNLEAVLEFYAREEQKMTRSQRALDRLSRLIAQPLFLGLILVFVAVWVGANVILHNMGRAEFDAAPYFWLQGIIGLGALLTATVVLIKQDRQGKLAELRAHLDLKVTLLTEQKAAKLIELLEELRRDMPNVRNRHDPEAAELKQAMDPHGVLATLDERNAQVDPAKGAEGKKDSGANG